MLIILLPDCENGFFIIALYLLFPLSSVVKQSGTPKDHDLVLYFANM